MSYLNTDTLLEIGYGDSFDFNSINMQDDQPEESKVNEIELYISDTDYVHSIAQL